MYRPLFILLVLAFVLGSCEKDTRADTTLKVFIGDNLRTIPFNAQAINLDVQGVKVKYKGTVEPASSNNQGNSDDWVWLTTTPTIYNLVELYSGKVKMVAYGPVPGAAIKEMRFVLGNQNSINVNGQVRSIQLPAGSEYGFKIAAFGELDIPIDTLTIDFNTAKSILYANGSFVLNPAFAIR
jgi:hypothetical protein